MISLMITGPVATEELGPGTRCLRFDEPARSLPSRIHDPAKGDAVFIGAKFKPVKVACQIAIRVRQIKARPHHRANSGESCSDSGGSALKSDSSTRRNPEPVSVVFAGN